MVGLLTDEGTPSAITARLRERLPRLLARQVSDRVTWQVEQRCEPLRLDEHGELPMLELADENRASLHWDVLVLLTDLPRRVGTQPIVSDYSTTHGVALLSVPGLGALRLTRRAGQLIAHLLGHLFEHRPEVTPEPHPHGPAARLVQRVSALLAPTAHIRSDDDGIDAHLALTGTRGRLRLLAGMVADNRPWRLVPHLSSATAAAAYGLITTTFWSMATALSPARLTVITIAAILAMTLWLIAYNHMWIRPADPTERDKAVLYNASAALTVLIGVACMYAVLYCVTLTAAGALISPDYFQAQLRHPVSITTTRSWCGSPPRSASSPALSDPASNPTTPSAKPPIADANKNAASTSTTTTADVPGYTRQVLG